MIFKKNVNHLVFLFFYFILIGFDYLIGQYKTDYTDLSSISNLLNIRSGTPDQFNASSTGVRRSIDENEYYIDSGDEFIVKIDIPGPEIKTLNIPVLSDGYFIVSESKGLYIRGLILKDAKVKIINHLKRFFPEAEIECYLDKTHPIKVTLLGALELGPNTNLNSADRIFTVLDEIYTICTRDSILSLRMQIASWRNISVIRKDIVYQYDYLKFKALGKLQNQYLQDNDKIYIPFKDTSGYTIDIDGMVGHPVRIEYKQGDNLLTSLALAGGVLPSADSSRIEIYRFLNKSKEFELITLSLPNDSSYLLYPDDRIIVRQKTSFHTKHYVSVIGEVRFPGKYPIIEDKTTLYEVINNAGGFTENASIKHSVLQRNLEVPGWRELNKLIYTLPQTVSLNWIESNFWRSASKENLDIVACDWEKLFLQKELNQDITLKNRDKINVPSRKVFVFVTGSVLYPGTILYNPDFNYMNYINAAGGFKEKSRPSRIKIIKYNTETWLDAKETVKIEPGDRIFVPQKDDKEPWDIFMQALTVVTQITTLIVITSSVLKP